MKKLCVLLSVCFYMSAYGTTLEKLQADLGATMPNKQAGVAIGYIGPDTSSISFVGNASFTEATLFEYGSITKVLTAIVLVELADEGVVGLTRSVNTYLPQGAQEERWQGVTLQKLATHTAGLPRLPPNMNLFYMLRHGENPYAAYDEKMLFEAVKRVQRQPTGEFNAYSNFGFGLLGTLLSRAAQTPYKSLVETRIFRPLGMRSAAVAGWRSANVAPPLTRGGDEASYWDFDAMAGAGAARGSIADALKLLQASMAACATPGALAHANCRAQQATGVRAAEYAAQGFGWIRSTSPVGEIVWHNGGTGGFSSFLGFNVQTGEGLVVLANVADLDAVTNLSLNFLAGLE